MSSNRKFKETEIGKIPEDWDLRTVDEIKSDEKSSIISGPFGSNISSRFFVSSGIPVIRGNNLREDMTRFIDEGFVFLTKEKADELHTWAKRGDIIFTAAGTIGQVGIIPEKSNYNEYIISNKQLRLRVNPNKILPLFAFYWLSSPKMVTYIQQRNTGSTIPLINLSILKSLPIIVPSLSEQRAIAKILSDLDAKIELNRQTNATFEAIAQSIFREWFVEFNFPNATGEIVESELGLIPSRCMVGTLGDILEVKGGTTPSTKEENFWNGEYYFATPKDLSNLTSPILLNTERKITKEGISQISSGILPAGTLLLSSRAPIGYLAISNIPVSINQGFIAINAKKTSNLFALHWLKENMETVISRANGSTFLEITKTNFKEIEIVIPDPETTKRFDEIVSPIFEQIKNNEQQSATLASIRDALLPKLMSGEIEV